MDPSGTWEGQLSGGERGTFPFTYIQFVDESDDAAHWDRRVIGRRAATD